MQSKSAFNLSEKFNFHRTKKTVRNRTVLAAMTNKQSHANGVISDEEIQWLVRRAEGGFGIITTAAANVSIHGQGWEGELGVFDDMHIDRLKILTNKINLRRSIAIAQLFHGGMRSPESLTGKQPISASKIKCEESFTGFTRSASAKDINNIINDFTSAAIRCVESGFDGIELHGAHGYLISQFLGTKTNIREDRWGGNLKNRSRLLFEIYNSIKSNVPDSFIVGVRISPELLNIGITIDDSIKLVSILRDMKIDYIHLSCWDVFTNSQTHPNNPKTLTELIIENFDRLPPIISTGNIWSSIDAINTLKQGADLIGVARVGIAHPDWANNIHDLNYNPKKPPFTIEHLKSKDLSDAFINYMKRWKKFVKDK